MVAAGLDRAEVVKLLLARGADAKLASSIVDLNALTAPVEADPVSGRPQQQAAQPAATRPKCAGRDASVSLQRADRRAGRPDGAALRRAPGQLRSRCAALVDGGADVNLPSPGDKATPLLVAIINGHFDLAAFLLEHGADPNLVSDAGVSPLYATLNVQWAPIAAYPQPRALPAAEPHAIWT